MQSSGVGNCINMLSLTQGGRFPLLTLVSMRGEFGEGNPWQFAMGQAVEPVLKAMGVIVLRAEHPSDVIPCVSAAITMAFQSRPAGRCAADPAPDRREEILRGTPLWPN